MATGSCVCSGAGRAAGMGQQAHARAMRACCGVVPRGTSAQGAGIWLLWMGGGLPIEHTCSLDPCGAVRSVAGHSTIQYACGSSMRCATLRRCWAACTVMLGGALARAAPRPWALASYYSHARGTLPVQLRAHLQPSERPTSPPAGSESGTQLTTLCATAIDNCAH
jgi:hypothetical protein